ncbi:TraR/DksA family transcriptional regulator [Nakamurella endophytica]|uniref:DnaK suppressor protein n=1 Tax=Nakamurella endophytica TaxID=1748367 RepID=A0A917STI7_9ACTN|nr:TraR/DksA C4-type zinc finger protein [Nakamurella endophytica]GGL98257.1 DnaK suppressor protein [Nakamurella endophytica]
MVDEGQVRGGAPAAADPDAARESLSLLRRSLVAEMDEAHEELQAVRRLRTDRSDDDEHDPEGSPLSAEWSRLDGRYRAAQQRVRDVDAALATVDAGHYGICERCGQAIAPGRLEALPTATRCVRCAGRR